MEIAIPSLLRIKPKALHRLGKYLRNEGFTEVGLVLGKGISDLFGDQLMISFASSDVRTVYQSTVSSTDIEDIFETAKLLPSHTKALVAVGGGKAIDTGKFLGHVLKIPTVSVPTVTSNDGICSPLASLVVEGKRRTMRTEIPHGVILDTEVIGSAPTAFHYSGMGDLFCKLTAIYDWKLAFKKTGEYVNDFAAMVAQNAVDTFVQYRAKDLSQPAYHGIIASSLVMSGIAMEIAKSSRPASGSEHLISHAYDALAPEDSLHGLQVGVAAYAVSFLQGVTHDVVKQAAQECGFIDFVAHKPLKTRPFIEAIKTAPQIKSNFYTVLSEPGSIPRLIDFVDSDPFLNQMIS